MSNEANGDSNEKLTFSKLVAPKFQKFVSNNLFSKILLKTCGKIKF